VLGARAQMEGPPALLARPAVSGSDVLGLVLSFTHSLGRGSIIVVVAEKV